MIVKEIYEVYPKIHYPLITLQEISNESVARFFDGDKDTISYLAYQITINATQTETLTAVECTKDIADIIIDYLQGDKYKCMRRIGSLAIMPLATDNNVITGTLRYECYVDSKTNTIYRRD